MKTWWVGFAGAALASALPACKTQQKTSADPPTSAELPEPAPAGRAEKAGEVDKDEDRRVLTPEVAQRLAEAATKHPKPFLAVRGAKKAPALRAPLNRPVKLDLAVPGIAHWADASVARFVVRVPGGVQDSVKVDEKVAPGLATYTFRKPGPAMLMLCAGPKGSTDVPDPTSKITHCSKVILSVDGPGAVEEGDDDFLGETGLPLDVEPLVSPVRLRVGSELPVRIHYMGEEEGNAEVVALRPDGSVERQTTSRSGVAHFQINQAGRWTIRFVRPHEQGERVGELVFDVAEGQR